MGLSYAMQHAIMALYIIIIWIGAAHLQHARMALYIIIVPDRGCSPATGLIGFTILWIGAARQQQALLALLLYGSGLPACSRPYWLYYYTDWDYPPPVGHIGFISRLG